MYRVKGINFETEKQAEDFVKAYEDNPFMMERLIKEVGNTSFYAGLISAGVVCIGIIFGVVLGKRK